MADSNNNLVTFTINGKEISVPKGTTVLEAAKMNGINIPTFCWHPKLKPVGACRICYVEIEKMPKLMVSCATEAMPGMVVFTESEKVKKGRKAVIEFILINHPLDCPTCDKGGECDLQDLTFAHAIDDSRFDFNKMRFIRDKSATFDDVRIGPEIIRNQNRCILCYKCVRANNEVFGEHDLGAYQRGNITEIDAPPGEQVDSLYSGNLVEICPVGALTNTDWRYKIRVWNTQTVNSICPYHADGANIKLWKDRNRIFRVTSRRNDEIDEGWLSDITRYGYQIAKPDNRLTTPLVKKGDSQVPVQWEEALGLIARRFKEIKDNKGGVCLGGIISPNMDCTSVYAFSKFFRTILNSNNVDFRTEYKMLPEAAGDLYGKMTSRKFTIAEIERADVIAVVGSDIMREHPNVNLWIHKAVTRKHASLYIANPVETSTGRIANDEIIYNIGTLDAFLNGVCVAIIESGLADQSVNTGDFARLIEPNTVEGASKISGISAERIRAFAKAIVGAQNPCIITGEIFTFAVNREKLAGALHNLALLSGLYKKGQVGVLPRAANSKGCEKLGVMPHLSAKMQSKLKEIWGTYPDVAGLASDRMIVSANKEELDALFVIGSNPVFNSPDGLFVKEGVEKLDFLVVADLYESETSQMADVVLPLSSWAEYADRFVNLEGRVQKFEKAINPIPHSRPAFDIINSIAKELKNPLFESKDKLQKDIDSLLEFDSADEPEMKPVEVKYTEDKKTPGFDIPMLIVDQVHHYGHWTEKTHSLSEFCNEAFLEISPALAEKLNVDDGTIVRVESEVARINLPVKISEIIDGNVVLAYRNFATSPVNNLQMRKRRVDWVKIARVEGSKA